MHLSLAQSLQGNLSKKEETYFVSKLELLLRKAMSPTLKLVRGEIENIQYNSLDINRQSNIHMELLTKIQYKILPLESGQGFSMIWPCYLVFDSRTDEKDSNLA